MKSLNVFFSKTTCPVFTRFHTGPSVEGMLTLCSNGSASLSKMAPCMVKTLKKSSPVLRKL